MLGVDWHAQEEHEEVEQLGLEGNLAWNSVVTLVDWKLWDSQEESR